ncbi:hypothetical protein [uncultured Phenylobacterium sp.]|uniref:hypothetical protein n=1 Tax=uncultured Phenylobacterium sp. TaxID=349273 RepID=UPI0025F8D6C8|nr:hypothetical protein [uncultured Phenylobacterium sp.]
MLAVEKLRILVFPQRIDGRALDLNVLLLPTQRLLNVQDSFPSVADPAVTVRLPRFINASLGLEVQAIAGLKSYPYSNPALLPAGTVVEPFDAGVAMPPGLPALYEGLRTQFQLTADGDVRNTEGAPPPTPDGIQKYLPHSYRAAFNFTNPRTEFAKIDDSYHCAIAKSSTANPAFPRARNEVTWGRVMAFCLRQPLLAQRIGLLHRVSLALPRDDYFADGGWLYCNLVSDAADFDILGPGELRRYAARVPPIEGPRQLFAALQFPVVDAAGGEPSDFDTLRIEASDYDDGFAKVVHATQPVSANVLSEAPDGIHVQKDIGVRLGWDDEQILIWQNRQFLPDPATPGKRTDAPLGVFSYRLDARRSGQAAWNSLTAIQAQAALTLGGETVAPAGAELETGVQVFPAKVNADLGTAYWLPSYFTQWYGASLVLPDGRAAALDASGALADPGTYGDSRIPKNPGQAGDLYAPRPPADCELKYGEAYDFRVRLADLTGGGPRVDDDELNDAPSTQASLVFRRYVAPKALSVTPLDPQPVEAPGSVKLFAGRRFAVRRPRLEYPALLFTELDTEVAFQQLLDDRDALHADKLVGQNINEYRAVSAPDPDADSLLVIVEVRTLHLDNLASITQREPFIPLYTTLRRFDADPDALLALDLEYRDANVIDFGNEIDLGDLALSKADIDNGDTLVLPRSRDIRITVYPVCSDKPGKPAYFGFARTRFGDRDVRVGEAAQFFVRENSADEVSFFANGLASQDLQGLYLQPDPVQVNNPDTLVSTTVAGATAPQSSLMARLASRLRCDFKGLTLVGKPGERVQFGCSHRIRHTLAPDNSSLTFATQDDLTRHWLCVASFDVQRDWTWDGLGHHGVEVRRTRQFTDEPATAQDAVVGYVRWQRTASRVATTNPDRSRTRIVFVDAVEPKKDATDPATLARPFPNTLEVSYALTPLFIGGVDPDAGGREQQTRSLTLPVTINPVQVPKVIGAGYALSPYRRDHAYSETAPRERFLWLEFDEPIADPNDDLFARVLAYAPDPLLSFPNPDQLLVRQDEPPLAIEPEPIRVITTDATKDDAGLDAMPPMTPETPDPATPLVKVTPTRYLMPLPAALHAESPELLGFFTYEFRIGHSDRIWSTAQGRWGRPTRLAGVQHPAPPLKLVLDRTPARLSATVQFATAVFEGRNVTSRPPKTEIWSMLYAQATQADGREVRNILLAEARAELPKVQQVDPKAFLETRAFLSPKAFNGLGVNLDGPLTGVCSWDDDEIRDLLNRFQLGPTTALSVLAVEMTPRYDRFIALGPDPDLQVRPLSASLGQYRILRTSPLVAAPDVC